MNLTASMLALSNPISFSIRVSTSVIFVSLTLISSLILPFSRFRSSLTPAWVRLISSRSFCFNRVMSPRRRSFSARRLMKSVRSESSRDCLRAEKSTYGKRGAGGRAVRWREDMGQRMVTVIYDVVERAATARATTKRGCDKQRTFCRS